MRKKTINLKVLFWFLWVLMVVFFSNKYAFEIDQFNAATRILFKTGNFNVRHFNSYGLPISVDVRANRKLISPFYVVHYGLMHSESLRRFDYEGKEHWRRDDSILLWDAPPKELNSRQFEYNAYWILNNIKKINGKSHLLYDFDWRYKNYPGGGLSAPWWSGLTDGYAIILMLRAYDVYGDPDFISAAKNLYESVVTPFEEGGSLMYLNNSPWIEEYIDPLANQEKMSRVLNGMIYAYKGVKAYELTVNNKITKAEELRQSIIKSVKLFSINNWSYYDQIGNVSNIKYHRIHVSLLMNEDFKTDEVSEIIARWSVGVNNSGLYWIKSPGLPVAKIHFLVIFFIGIIFPYVVSRLVKNKFFK